jgi:hypothetical protein
MHRNKTVGVIHHALVIDQQSIILFLLQTHLISLGNIKVMQSCQAVYEGNDPIQRD